MGTALESLPTDTGYLRNYKSHLQRDIEMLRCLGHLRKKMSLEFDFGAVPHQTTDFISSNDVTQTRRIVQYMFDLAWI